MVWAVGPHCSWNTTPNILTDQSAQPHAVVRSPCFELEKSSRKVFQSLMAVPRRDGVQSVPTFLGSAPFISNHLHFSSVWMNNINSGWFSHFSQTTLQTKLHRTKAGCEFQLVKLETFTIPYWFEGSYIQFTNQWDTVFCCADLSQRKNDTLMWGQN